MTCYNNNKNKHNLGPEHNQRYAYVINVQTRIWNNKMQQQQQQQQQHKHIEATYVAGKKGVSNFW